MGHINIWGTRNSTSYSQQKWTKIPFNGTDTKDYLEKLNIQGGRNQQ